MERALCARSRLMLGVFCGSGSRPILFSPPIFRSTLRPFSVRSLGPYPPSLCHSPISEFLAGAPYFFSASNFPQFQPQIFIYPTKKLPPFFHKLLLCPITRSNIVLFNPLYPRTSPFVPLYASLPVFSPSLPIPHVTLFLSRSI